MHIRTPFYDQIITIDYLYRQNSGLFLWYIIWSSMPSNFDQINSAQVNKLRAETVIWRFQIQQYAHTQTHINNTLHFVFQHEINTTKS